MIIYNLLIFYSITLCFKPLFLIDAVLHANDLTDLLRYVLCKNRPSSGVLKSVRRIHHC